MKNQELKRILKNKKILITGHTGLRNLVNSNLF